MERICQIKRKIKHNYIRMRTASFGDYYWMSVPGDGCLPPWIPTPLSIPTPWIPTPPKGSETRDTYPRKGLRQEIPTPQKGPGTRDTPSPLRTDKHPSNTFPQLRWRTIKNAIMETTPTPNEYIYYCLVESCPEWFENHLYFDMHDNIDNTFHRKRKMTQWTTRFLRAKYK